MAAATPLVPAIAKGKNIPIGLELYSVRNELTKDPMGAVKEVAKLGYKVVEFYSPYFDWTDGQAKDMRKLLDDLGVKCLSTHNGIKSFSPEGLPRAIELNKIIGSKYIVLASAPRQEKLDGWKGIADTLNKGAEAMKSAGMRPGYHNHQVEFKPLEGKRPMEILASNTDKSVMLQLDVGTCLEAGSDPVAWINQNPGRIQSIHCKDWGPDKGYKVLLGEGTAPWKKIFEAAEKKGGVEFYLVEQEGSEFAPMETAQKCLASIRKILA